MQSIPDEGETRRRPVTPTSVIDENAILRCALEYAGLGLRVVRLVERSKKPNIRDWARSGATLDPQVISKWFGEQPHANLGIVGGAGVLILDIDPQMGGEESLSELLTTYADGALPETAIVQTGSGGRHIYFRLPLEVVIGSPVGFRAGVDIRCQGGQVVAPPSIHPKTGRPYVWMRHPREGIALIPRWLLGLLPSKSPSLKQTTGKVRGGGCGAHAASGDSASRQRRDQSSYEVADVTRGRPHNPSKRTPRSTHATLNDTQRIEALSDEMIKRFPVLDVGQRHSRMTPAVGSLFARCLSDDVILSVMLRWYDHFNKLGRIRSSRESMEGELIASLRTTRGNARFIPICPSVFHEAACARYQLPQAALDLLNTPVDQLRSNVEVGGETEHEFRSVSDGESQEGIPDPNPIQEEGTIPPIQSNCNGVTQTSVGLCMLPGVDRPEESTRNKANRSTVGRLCQSLDEQRFVELLVVIAAYQRDQTSGLQLQPNSPTEAVPAVHMTHDQLRRIAVSRFHLEMPVWENAQIDRLKRKFINRLKCNGEREPATRFELLREISKGERPRRGDRGTPSKFEPTGIEIFMRAVSEADSSPRITGTAG
jgi:hypothetical protein